MVTQPNKSGADKTAAESPDGRLAYISSMIRITITAAAFEAIAATLPSSVGVKAQRAPNGDYKGMTLLAAAMLLAPRAPGPPMRSAPNYRKAGQRFWIATPDQYRTCIRRLIAGLPRWKRSPSSSATIPPPAYFPGDGGALSPSRGRSGRRRAEIGSLDEFIARLTEPA